MNDIQIAKKGKINVVDSRVLHKQLMVRSQHADWLRRRIDNYGFEEGKDFYSEMSESTGGRRAKTFLITLDMAKELSMLENSDIGRNVRKYFISRDSELRSIETHRLAGILTRKSLTDEIKDTGENERMHGHGFSTYTRLAYKLTGIKKGSRDDLSVDDLDRLETVEGIMKGLLKAGKCYSDIKEALLPIFKEG